MKYMNYDLSTTVMEHT